MFGPVFSIGRRVPALLSAAADVALGKPGFRTAAYLAERMRGGSARRGAMPADGPPSLGLALKVGTDEAFRTLMVALSDAPTPHELALIKGEVDDADTLYRANGWYADASGYHREPPPLESPTSSKVSLFGSDYRHLRFESEYEPDVRDPGRERWLSYSPVRTAHAWILRHRGRPRPWLICIHGFRMGWPMADFTAFRAAWLHGVLGLNVAIPVLPLHGQRSIGGQSGDGFFSAQLMDTIHAESQAIWDLRRLITWIRSLGADDIGVYGVSLGAYTTALLAGLEGNLACAIAGMPPTSLPQLLRLHAPARLLRNAEAAGLSWEQVDRVASVISPLSMAPQLPRERRYIFAGTADRVIPREHMHDLWSHWQEPTTLWYEGSHLSFTWETDIADFVHRSLHEAGLLWAPRMPRAGAQSRAA